MAATTTVANATPVAYSSSSDEEGGAGISGDGNQKKPRSRKFHSGSEDEDDPKRDGGLKRVKLDITPR